MSVTCNLMYFKWLIIRKYVEMFTFSKCVFYAVCISPLCRDVLQCTMITHQILLRGAAQCCLLQTTMHLTDVVSLGFCVLFCFIFFFFPDVIEIQ